MFAGFEERRIRANGLEIALVRGGTGPALLLLHGHPQTHAIWHKIAEQLATRFTVVAADLRGYGDSDKPEGLPDHGNYSKRVMAQDQVDVMCALGHEDFFLVGHDRGGRVAYRLALDHPQRVKKLVTLDIAPTLAMYEQTTMEFAKARTPVITQPAFSRRIRALEAWVGAPLFDRTPTVHLTPAGERFRQQDRSKNSRFLEQPDEADEIVFLPAGGDPLVVALFETCCLFEQEREVVRRFQRQTQILVHVLEGKLGAVIMLPQFGFLQVGETGMGQVAAQGRKIDVVRNARGTGQRQAFAQDLANTGDVHVHRELKRGSASQGSDVQDSGRDRLENRTGHFDQPRITTEIINCFTLFRRQLAAGEGRLQKKRTGFLHLFRKLQRPFRRDGARLDYQLPWPKLQPDLIEHRLHGRWIGDKDEDRLRLSHRLLNRGVKIRKRLGRSIPTAHGIAVVY